MEPAETVQWVDTHEVQRSSPQDDYSPNEEESSEYSEEEYRRHRSMNGSARRRRRRPAWSQLEEAILAKQHSIRGNSWSAIADHLPGRTSSEVKNIWHSTLRSKKLKARSLLRAYARLIHERGDSATARHEAFKAAVKLVKGEEDSHAPGGIILNKPANQASANSDDDEYGVLHAANGAQPSGSEDDACAASLTSHPTGSELRDGAAGPDVAERKQARALQASARAPSGDGEAIRRGARPAKPPHDFDGQRPPARRSGADQQFNGRCDRRSDAGAQEEQLDGADDGDMGPDGDALMANPPIWRPTAQRARGGPTQQRGKQGNQADEKAGEGAPAAGKRQPPRSRRRPREQEEDDDEEDGEGVEQEGGDNGHQMDPPHLQAGFGAGSLPLMDLQQIVYLQNVHAMRQRAPTASMDTVPPWLRTKRILEEETQAEAYRFLLRQQLLQRAKELDGGAAPLEQEAQQDADAGPPARPRGDSRGRGRASERPTNNTRARGSASSQGQSSKDLSAADFNPKGHAQPELQHALLPGSSHILQLSGLTNSLLPHAFAAQHGNNLEALGPMAAGLNSKPGTALPGLGVLGGGTIPGGGFPGAGAAADHPLTQLNLMNSINPHTGVGFAPASAPGMEVLDQLSMLLERISSERVIKERFAAAAATQAAAAQVAAAQAAAMQAAAAQAAAAQAAAVQVAAAQAAAAQVAEAMRLAGFQPTFMEAGLQGAGAMSAEGLTAAANLPQPMDVGAHYTPGDAKTTDRKQMLQAQDSASTRVGAKRRPEQRENAGRAVSTKRESGLGEGHGKGVELGRLPNAVDPSMLLLPWHVVDGALRPRPWRGTDVEADAERADEEAAEDEEEEERPRRGRGAAAGKPAKGWSGREEGRQRHTVGNDVRMAAAQWPGQGSGLWGQEGQQERRPPVLHSQQRRAQPPPPPLQQKPCLGLRNPQQQVQMQPPDDRRASLDFENAVGDVATALLAFRQRAHVEHGPDGSAGVGPTGGVGSALAGKAGAAGRKIARKAGPIR